MSAGWVRRAAVAAIGLALLAGCEPQADKPPPEPMAARPRQVPGVMALRRSGRDSVTVAAPGAGWSRSSRRPTRARSAGAGVNAGQRFVRALPRVAPPRPRSDTPFSVRMRCTKP